MFIQTEITPNPNSLKFIPRKKISNDTPFEVTDKKMTNNELVRNILSINGVTGVFLAGEFLSVNKEEKIEWEDLKHIIISFINNFYSKGPELLIKKNYFEETPPPFPQIENPLINIFHTKVRPAAARDERHPEGKNLKLE
jgi:Scaffold protein Nfu/NifU N terminal.